MGVVVVWDTWLKEGAEAEGCALTRQVWSDMRTFEGYVSHELLVDQDAPGHILALGRWRMREDAGGCGAGATAVPRVGGGEDEHLAWPRIVLVENGRQMRNELRRLFAKKFAI